jgi:hypothetical protein
MTMTVLQESTDFQLFIGFFPYNDANSDRQNYSPTYSKLYYLKTIWFTVGGR